MKRQLQFGKKKRALCLVLAASLSCSSGLLLAHAAGGTPKDETSTRAEVQAVYDGGTSDATPTEANGVAAEQAALSAVGAQDASTVEITNQDLVFLLQQPGKVLTPTAAQNEKFQTSYTWTQAGEPAETFAPNTYYRADIVLTALTTEDTEYVFKKNPSPYVIGQYEILNRQRSEDGKTFSFSVTYRCSDSLTDKASHLYHEGEAGMAEALDKTIHVRVNDTEITYSLRQLEQMALEGAGVEADGYTGLSLYGLLNEGDRLNAASDSSRVSIDGTDLLLSDLRADGGNACLLAYGTSGTNGSPLPALALEKSGEVLVSDVTDIQVDSAEKGALVVDFVCSDLNLTGTVVVKDQYGNTVFTGDVPGGVELRAGETFSYAVTSPGYSTVEGTVSTSGTVYVTLLKLWDGKYTEPAVDDEGYFLIGTADELAWFNRESTRVSQDAALKMRAANVRITNDIDMTGYDWTPIATFESNNGMAPSTGIYNAGPYNGTFDGGKHTIHGLTIDRDNIGNDYFQNHMDAIGGLFGYATNATIKDLGVQGRIRIKDRNYAAYNYLHIGGLVGFSQRQTHISGCYVDMDITLTQADDARACSTFVGGIVGSLSLGGKIESSYSTGSIHAVALSQLAVGGIAGSTRTASGTVGQDNYINNVMTMCWSDMDLTAKTGGTGNIGGIVGWVGFISASSIPEISYCFALNDVLDGQNANVYAGRLVGNGELFSLGGDYNFALDSMEIRDALIADYDDTDSGYRNSWGRDITRTKALDTRGVAYTNVYWPEEGLWNYSDAERYPFFVWEDGGSIQTIVQRIVSVGRADNEPPLATVQPGDLGWQMGEQNFTVTGNAGKTVYVLQQKEDGSFQRLEEAAVDGTHTYTATLDGQAPLYLLLAGDVNLDGEVDIADLVQLRAHASGSQPIEEELGQIAGDVNGDGGITLADIALIAGAMQGTASLPW